MINHQNKFSTNFTGSQSAGVTTSALNSIPSIEAPFYLAFDATDVNGHYEIVYVTSKTATNVNHASTSYAHSADEVVRCVIPAVEMDNIQTTLDAGWKSVSDTWTYASADSPTFTITVPSGAASLYSPGMRIKLTQTTVKYFIVTAVTDTVLTVYGGTDYTLVNAAISAIYVSTMKAPLGFPLSTTKWTGESTSSGRGTISSPNINQWYNPGGISLSVPIGAWKVGYNSQVGINKATAVNSGSISLSTADNSESDTGFTTGWYSSVATSYHSVPAHVEKTKLFASKTPLYLVARSTQSGATSLDFYGDLTVTRIFYECAYL